MIVEDDGVLALDLSLTIRNLGYQVAGTVASGEQAIAKAAETSPDLVLTDIGLPGAIDGIQAAEMILGSRDTAIIFMTASDDQATLERARAIQSYGFLKKPFSRFELRAGIETALYRHSTDKRLRESEEQYRTLAELSPDGICVEVDRRVVFANNAMARILGCASPVEIIGRNMLEIAHPDFHESMLKRMELVFQERVPVPFLERRYMRKDGTLADVEVAAVPFTYRQQPAAQVMVRDVSRRKQAERALRQSEERFRSMIVTANEGIWALDADGNTTFANPAMAEMLRCPASEMLGRSLFHFVDTEWFPVAKRLCERRHKGISERYDFKFRRADGSELWGIVSAVPTVDDQGEYNGGFAMVTDVTDRKRSERVFRQAERLRAVADLASGIAHNFNNMLQVVLGSADLALMSLESGDIREVKDCLARIQETSRFGTETVRRLNTFASVNEGGRNQKTEVFDLSEIARHAVEMTKTWWKANPEKAGVRIDLKINAQGGALVKGLKSELFEVLVNLIKNSAEAMPQGGELEIIVSRIHGKILLLVRDTGVGIAAKDLARVFTPFFSTKREKGTGLGLATSKSIVDGHGGRMMVDSAESRGTSIIICLPAADEGADQPKQALGSESLQPLTVLVVDDMEAMVSLLSSGLSRYNHKVLDALSGDEAVRIFTENHVDLVLCDLAMPGMTGWQVGKAIKDICDIRNSSRPPFVILTGWTDQGEEVEKIEESCVDAVIEKPVDFPELVKVMDRLVRAASGEMRYADDGEREDGSSPSQTN